MGFVTSGFFWVFLWGFVFFGGGGVGVVLLLLDSLHRLTTF